MNTTKKSEEPVQENKRNQSSDVYERTGSTEHNDYKITGRDEAKKVEKKDEGGSYQNYNGNSEANNPAKAE